MPTDIDEPIPERSEEKGDYKTWLCALCGLVYSERDGWPDDGIAPGTRWADVPQEWVCPDCGATKSEFEMVEVTGI